jgi:hypothetical protein
MTPAARATVSRPAATLSRTPGASGLRPENTPAAAAKASAPIPHPATLPFYVPKYPGGRAKPGGQSPPSPSPQVPR